MEQNLEKQRDAFIERIFDSLKGAFDIFGLYLGVRLGLYKALAEGGPADAGELAGRAGANERYVREWLEQQTVTGILSVEDEKAPAGKRRYSLPAAFAEPLTDRESLNYVAPITRLFAGAVKPLPSLVKAFRSGQGVPYADYGPDLIEGQGEINRPAFLYQLGQEWIPSMTDVDARLKTDPPARIADVGCGAGWSAIGMARSYPGVQVDGFDLDESSIELARSNAAGTDVADRVSFQVRDAGEPELTGRYQLVTALECVHDMSQPVKALSAMRNLVDTGGTVLIADERVGEEFTAAGTDVEWMMYGWSVLHCLAVGMEEQPSAETGTVMRPGTLKHYAEQAGFSKVEVLPIDNFFFRFYRLTP